jgi:hypothetical protein
MKWRECSSFSPVVPNGAKQSRDQCGFAFSSAESVDAAFVCIRGVASCPVKPRHRVVKVRAPSQWFSHNDAAQSDRGVRAAMLAGVSAGRRPVEQRGPPAPVST